MKRVPARIVQSSLLPGCAVKTLGMILCGLLCACVHQEQVTTPPAFAVPQHLVSLCDREIALTVSNRGEFMTAGRPDRAGRLLLSAQFTAPDPATQRLVTDIELKGSAAEGVSVFAFDGTRRWLLASIAAESLHCDSGGEMLLDYPPDSFYFWASVGKKQRELAIWSNAAGDLVLQHRWREEHTGLVSGFVSGDAWARFTASHSLPTVSGAVEASTADVGMGATTCVPLTGRYLPVAETVNPDGSLDSRRAAQQFFREELVGVHPLNLDEDTATEMRVEHDAGTGVSISLYEGDTLLGSRNLPAESFRCEDGRWLFRGDRQLHSAWLLFAASGGVHWEDLRLWRDRKGELVVEGTHTQRALLFLIPFGGTQTLFMAFPPASSVRGVGTRGLSENDHSHP